MPEISYPTQNIHLLPNRSSIRSAHTISFIGTLFVLLSAVVLLICRFFNFNFWDASLTNVPIIVGFITTSAAILLSKKNTKFQLLGMVPISLGLVTMLNTFLQISLLSILSAGALKTGMLFVIIGLSLIISILKIPHRYHFMQIIIMAAVVISLFSFLEMLYHFILLGTFSEGQAGPFGPLLFFILSQSIIFMKSDRGFIGLFNTDSRSSQLARMSIRYFIAMPPLLGLLLLLGENLHILNASSRLALLVVMVIVLSIALSWINVRSLYSSEVEHFLMREALRVNNISLELNATDLSTQITQLEKAKQDVAKKLENQQTLVDIMDSS